MSACSATGGRSGVATSRSSFFDCEFVQIGEERPSRFEDIERCLANLDRKIARCGMQAIALVAAFPPSELAPMQPWEFSPAALGKIALLIALYRCGRARIGCALCRSRAITIHLGLLPALLRAAEERGPLRELDALRPQAAAPCVPWLRSGATLAKKVPARLGGITRSAAGPAAPGGTHHRRPVNGHRPLSREPHRRASPERTDVEPIRRPSGEGRDRGESARTKHPNMSPCSWRRVGFDHRTWCAPVMYGGCGFGLGRKLE